MSHEIFSWQEIGHDEKEPIVEITTSGKHVEIDAVTRDAMIEIQQEILDSFPPHSVKLLIDLSLLEIKFATLKEVSKQSFVTDLLKLGQKFNRLIVFSGSGSVSLIIRTLGNFGPLIGVRVEQANDRNRALEIAQKTPRPK